MRNLWVVALILAGAPVWAQYSGGGGGSGVSDHGALTGLTDDDHAAYSFKTESTDPPSGACDEFDTHIDTDNNILWICSANQEWEMALTNTGAAASWVHYRFRTDASNLDGWQLQATANTLQYGPLTVGTGEDNIAVKFYAAGTGGFEICQNSNINICAVQDVTGLSADRTITWPDENVAIAGSATTTTFTNKTFDADGTGNSLSNVDPADLDDAADTPGDEECLTYEATGTVFEWQTCASGAVDTSGTPVLNDFARFTDADTIEGRSYAEVAADLSLEIGTDVQAYDADLTTYAGITPSANVQTLLGAANYAAFKTSLSLDAVENTALSTWAGTANITTLGTITTGTWNGTDLDPDRLAGDGTDDNLVDQDILEGFGASATPGIAFKDSDAGDGDDNVTLAVNCTDIGSGTEDCDFTASGQIAGADTNFLAFDADGSLTLGTAGVGVAFAGDVELPNDVVDIADLNAGTDGELITWDASGDPATVSVGTSGQVLTSNGAGAAPTFQAAAGGSFDPSTSVQLYEEFALGYNVDGQVGTNGIHTIEQSSGTGAPVIGSAAHPGLYRLNSHATNDNSGASLVFATDPSGDSPMVYSFLTAYDWNLDVVFLPGSNSTAITDMMFFVGFTENTNLNSTYNALGIRYDTDLSDSFYRPMQCDDNGAAGCQSTDDDTNMTLLTSTIAPSGGTYNRFRVSHDADGGPGSTSLYSFQVNDETALTMCSSGCDGDLDNEVTGTSKGHLIVEYLTRTTTGVISGDIDYLFFSASGLSRY